MATASTRQRSANFHFLDLARHGEHPGASGGEQRAHRLAWAIIADVPGLDPEAVNGLKAFIELTCAAPATARDLITQRSRFTARRAK